MRNRCCVQAEHHALAVLRVNLPHQRFHESLHVLSNRTDECVLIQLTEARRVSLCMQEEHAEDEEASEGEAEKPVDVLTGNIDRDKLPGGTVVVWGGQRPQWFTALKQQQPQPDRRQRSAQAVEAPPNVSNKPTVGTGEPLSLSEKQRKKCLKVACKMLKRCEGGIKLKEVVDSALAALKVSQSVDAVTLRSKVKTVIKKGDGWSIQGGKLMAAIAVSS